jgi:hypothetical protein
VNLTPERLQQLREYGRKPERLAALQAGHEERRRIRDDSLAFQRELFATVDADSHPGKRALIISAVASYRAIALLSLQVLSARKNARIHLLADRLQPLQGELRRTLELLGVATQDTGDEPSEPTLEDIKREYAQKKRRRGAAADGEVEPASS